MSAADDSEVEASKVPRRATFTDVTETMRTVNADQRFPRKKPYSSIVIDYVSRAGQVRRSQHCRGHRDRHASVHSSRSPVPCDLRAWYHLPRYMRPSVRHFLVMSLDLPYTPRRAVYGDCKATASAPVDETGRSKLVGGQYRSSGHIQGPGAAPGRLRGSG